MKIAKIATGSLVMALTLVASTGCATVRTISAVQPGSPMVFTGTRLDLNAISGDEIGNRKFRVTPPTYPLVDLPLSIVADTLIFPLTFSVATYEFIFH